MFPTKLPLTPPQYAPHNTCRKPLVFAIDRLTLTPDSVPSSPLSNTKSSLTSLNLTAHRVPMLILVPLKLRFRQQRLMLTAPASMLQRLPSRFFFIVRSRGTADVRPSDLRCGRDEER